MRTFVQLAAILLIFKIASPTILVSLEELILEMIDFIMIILEQAQV